MLRDAAVRETEPSETAAGTEPGRTEVRPSGTATEVLVYVIGLMVTDFFVDEGGMAEEKVCCKDTDVRLHSWLE